MSKDNQKMLNCGPLGYSLQNQQVYAVYRLDHLLLTPIWN